MRGFTTGCSLQRMTNDNRREKNPICLSCKSRLDFIARIEQAFGCTGACADDKVIVQLPLLKSTALGNRLG